MKDMKREHILSAPTDVSFHLTHACNLKCLHCYIDAGSSEKDELNEEEMNKVLDKLIESKIFRIFLTGGEPMLRKDFMDIIKKLHMKMWMTLSTNGYYINEDNIQELSKYIKEYAISVDGATPDSHDNFRGIKGSFDKAINAINIINQNKGTVAMNTALSRHNIHEIEKIIDMGKYLNVKAIRFSTLYPKGRAIEHKALFLDNEEIKNAISRILNKSKEIRVDFDDSFQIPLKLYYKNSKHLRGDQTCGIGYATITIMPNGNLIPCEFFQESPEFIIGNILKDDLKQLWKGSQILDFVRKEKTLKYPDICRSCRHDSKCLTIKCPALIITKSSWCNWYEKK